jgi:hypothetical protein
MPENVRGYLDCYVDVVVVLEEVVTRERTISDIGYVPLIIEQRVRMGAGGVVAVPAIVRMIA